MSPAGGLQGLCRLAIALTGFHWLSARQGLWFGVAFVSLLLTFLPARLIRDALLAEATAVVVAVLLAAHVVFGMQGGLYETSSVYDKLVHAIGTGAVTVVLIVATQRYDQRRGIELPLVLSLMLVLGGAVTAGTFWELFEFAVDRTGLFAAQRGLHDTMLDLLADTLGALLVVSAFAVKISLRRQATAAVPE